MVEYLYNTSQKMIGQSWTHENRSWVFETCVENNLFDVALRMVIDLPKLSINGNVLRLLARKRNAFLPPLQLRIFIHLNLIFSAMYLYKEKEKEALQLLRIILKDIIKLPKTEIDDLMRGPPDEDVKEKYSSRALFLAAEMGNTAFVVEVIQQYPHLALEVNDDNHSIFHVAVLHRHLGIYNLLLEKNHMRDLIITLEDKKGNNILHLVGEYANGNGQPNISRMGRQTDIELQWFKRVESIVPDYLFKKKNTDGLTPYELFIKNHEDLFSKEENLKKETVSQLMVVAELVATISFAAIFTFPGGYHQDTGIPIFLRKTLSKLFIVSTSLAFWFSTTSIMMVISILIFDPDRYDRFKISSSVKVQRSMALVLYSIITIIITYLINLFILYQAILNG